MLTPQKIRDLIRQINDKHTRTQYGLYPPQRKIVTYILKQTDRLNKDPKLTSVEKVLEMTNLLEGFIRYLNDTNKILKLDVEKVLTYIYYPETEELTLTNKDNLLIGKKGDTVRVWHDAYFKNNRIAITNRLIDCKNVLYDRGKSSAEHMKNVEGGMPEQMEKKYQEMFSEQSQSVQKFIEP